MASVRSAPNTSPTAIDRAEHHATISSGLAGISCVPPPVNEPNLAYLPGSPERKELKARLKSMAAERIDIPIVIGGRTAGAHKRSIEQGDGWYGFFLDPAQAEKIVIGKIGAGSTCLFVMKPPRRS